MPSATRQLNPVERFLRLFTEVRTGEATTVLLLTANVFLILAAHYLVKPVRKALILAGGGAEVESYATAGQVILLLGAVPLYGLLADRLPRRRLINSVTAFFVACLVVFYFLGLMKVPVGIPFFLWASIFNLMTLAQFWSFANDVYTNDEGKRLFPIVAFGASSGAVLGAIIARWLIQPIGVYQLLLVAGAILMLALAITNLLDVRERRRTEAARSVTESTASMPAATPEVRLESGEFRIADLEAEEKKPAPSEATKQGEGDFTGTGPFRLVFKSRYLLLIALLALFLNWVNTTGEYILSRTVKQAATAAVAAGTVAGGSEASFIGQFYSQFYTVVNLVGLLVQLFLVSRIIRYLGVRVAIVIMPAISLLGYASVALFPILALIRWVKTAENATDYSIQSTTKNILFLPTTREQKYKAKQAIDTMFHRGGDLLQGALVFVGTTVFAFQTSQFAIANVCLVSVWLVFAIMVGREYTRLAKATQA